VVLGKHQPDLQLEKIIYTTAVLLQWPRGHGQIIEQRRLYQILQSYRLFESLRTGKRRDAANSGELGSQAGLLLYSK
jgi:hypothetical protein